MNMTLTHGQLTHVFLLTKSHTLKGLKLLSGLFPCRAVKEALQSLHYTILVKYFGDRDWMYQDTNVRSLLAKLTQEDRDIFSFDIKQLKWNEYLESCVKGVRQYVLKDDPTTLPQARKHHKTYVRKQSTTLSWLNTVNKKAQT